MTLRRKLGHYAGELAFALRTPARIGDRASLVGQTIGFHWRNWRKAAPGAAPRITIHLRLCGRVLPVTLRPHDSDLAVLHEIFARRSYLISETLLPPDNVGTIIDAGANVGLASLYLADRYRRARILAVEPNPENFALLKANTLGVGRIVPVQAAITSTRTAEVYIATAGRASHFKINGDGRGALVRGFTLSELMAAYGIPHTDLLKIDVEGTEAAIFARPEFLARTGVVAAELHGDYDLGRFNSDIAAQGLIGRRSPFSREPGLVVAARPRPGIWPC